jgi:AraC-like DNA-binding protein
LIETVFRTDDLPKVDRFDYSRELMSGAPLPMDATCALADEFQMRRRDLHFDAVGVWSMAFTPAAFHRTEKFVRKFDPESYHVCLLLDGSMESAGKGTEAILEPFDFHVIDSSRPFELRAHSARGPISCVGIEVPKRVLSLPGGQADQVIGRPISGREGIGALLAGFLTQVTADTSHYRPADGPRLEVVATDLLSALLAHVIEGDDRHLTPDAQRRTLVLRVKSFIQRHLHDPDLNPGAIAAAHHISVSYLHRIFQGDGVAAWIREQRLERAREDLADPALVTLPVHQIAARWGFTHHAAFTRAFRTAYGIPPRDYRHFSATAPTNRRR